MIYDVCILGAGFGGLSTAALLRQQGLRVCVLEKANQPGGRARMTRRDGFLLDWGMHVFRFAEDGPMQKVFDRLRLPVDWVLGRHTGYVIADGAMHLAPNGPGPFLKTGLFSASEKLQIARITAKMLSARKEEWYHRPALEMVERISTDPRVKRAIAYSAFGIIAPELETTSCGELMDFLRAGLKAKRVLAPIVGGAGQIIDKLSEVVGEKNLRLGCTVKRLHVSNGQINKAETGKGDVHARAFVFNGPVQQLFDVIDPEPFPEAFQKYVRNFEPTSGISIDYALSDKVSEIEGGIICLGPWLGGYFPSNVDPTLAPVGKQLSTWFVTMDPKDVGIKKKRDQTEAALNGLIDRHFPGFFDKVMWKRKIVCPILDGVHLKVGQSFADRTPLRNQTFDNLWFAGDTAKAGGCSSGIAFNSALELADALPRTL